ncbi:hypothetical protein D3C87_1683300 [compost metagenome]
MKKSVLVLFLGISMMSAAQAAYESSVKPDMVSGTTNVTLSPTLVPLSISEEISDRTNKLVVAAQEDAQAFVATEGEIRGVKLNAAIRALRSELPGAKQATDMQLALTILGQ